MSQPYGIYGAGDQAAGAGVPEFRNPYASPVAPSSQGPYGSYGVTLTSVRHPGAVTSLVLGMVGMLFAPILLGVLAAIPAVVVSRKTHAAIDASQGRYSGRGLATAGFTMAIIGLTLSALVIVAIAASRG